jgi:hypothetical protein
MREVPSRPKTAHCTSIEGEFFLSKALAYAATSKTSFMGPITISRRELRSNDVNIEILYCGVCHTDIHTAHGEWDGLIYPNGTIYLCRSLHKSLSVLIGLNSAATSRGSPRSGLLPFSEGRVPRWGAVDLEVHDRQFETFAILLCHLILHE